MKKSLLFILLSNIGTFTFYGMQNNLLPLKTLSLQFIARNYLAQNTDTSYENFLNTYQRGILPKELIQDIWYKIIEHRFFEQNNESLKNVAIKAFSDSVNYFSPNLKLSEERKDIKRFIYVNQKEFERNPGIMRSMGSHHVLYEEGVYDNLPYQAFAFACNGCSTLFIAHAPLNCFFIIHCQIPFSTRKEFCDKQYSDELKQILENQLTNAFRMDQVSIYQDKKQALRTFFEQLDGSEEKTT